jgi:hypothetical protein
MIIPLALNFKSTRSFSVRGEGTVKFRFVIPFLTVLLLVSPWVAFKPVYAESGMGLVVTNSGITNINTTNPYNILEIPYNTPLGSTFNVEVHLVNATIPNAPNGIMGGEVHVDFSSLVTGAQPECTLVGATDNTSSLLGPGALMAIPFAVYQADGITQAPGPSYTGGVQVIFAGASLSATYNGNDVMLFNLTFKVNINEGLLGFGAPPPVPIRITYSTFADQNENPIPCYTIDDVYQLGSTGPPPNPRVRLDPLNLRAIGNWTSGYISLASGFDLSSINAASLLLNGTVSIDLSANTSIGNYDNSGNLSMRVEFNRTQMSSLLASTETSYGNVTVSLSGNLFDGTILVTSGQMQVSSLAGDINCDGKVNLADLVLLAETYGSTPTNANWNANADLIGNGKIGLLDLVLLATHYGQHVP